MSSSINDAPYSIQPLVDHCVEGNDDESFGNFKGASVEKGAESSPPNDSHVTCCPLNDHTEDSGLTISSHMHNGGTPLMLDNVADDDDFGDFEGTRGNLMQDCPSGDAVTRDFQNNQTQKGFPFEAFNQEGAEDKIDARVSAQAIVDALPQIVSSSDVDAIGPVQVLNGAKLLTQDYKAELEDVECDNRGKGQGDLPESFGSTELSLAVASIQTRTENVIGHADSSAEEHCISENKETNHVYPEEDKIEGFTASPVPVTRVKESSTTSKDTTPSLDDPFAAFDLLTSSQQEQTLAPLSSFGGPHESLSEDAMTDSAAGLL